MMLTKRSIGGLYSQFPLGRAHPIERPQNIFDQTHPDSDDALAHAYGGSDSPLEIIEGLDLMQPSGHRARRRSERERRVNGFASGSGSGQASDSDHQGTGSSSSRLTRMFEPPYELMRNLDLESVSTFFSFAIPSHAIYSIEIEKCLF